MSPRQKETILIGLFYLESCLDKDKETVDVIVETIGKDELLYSMVCINTMFSQLAITGFGSSSVDTKDLINRTREVIEQKF